MRKVCFFLIVIIGFVSCVGVHQQSVFNDYERSNSVKNTVAYAIDSTLLKFSPKSFRPPHFSPAVFKVHSYSGQGLLYFEAENIERFSLFINNKHLPVQGLRYKLAKSFFQLDISEYTKNGENTLYFCNPQLIDIKKNACLTVKMPYPIVVHKQLGRQQEKLIDLLNDIINSQIKHGFPGAQLLVIKDGTLICNKNYGYVTTIDETNTKLNQKIPITSQVLFDIASNTKIFATTLALQKLVFEKKLALQDKIVSFFPDFKDAKRARIKGKSSLTVDDLLHHRAGFPAGRGYHRRKQFKKELERGLSPRDITLQMILETPLYYTPRTKVRYSDIDFMLLGFIIEKVSGQRLDNYCQENLFQPLALTAITFSPLQNGYSKNKIAATELKGRNRFDSERKDRSLIHGVVHDEEAFFALDEVSGHAGLFANAESLALLAQLMLNGGGYGTVQLFDKTVARYFSNAELLEPSFARGWRKQGQGLYSWAFSAFAAPETIGHTGWTGSLTMLDAQQELVVVLLTNAKHSPVLRAGRRNVFAGDYYVLKRYGELIRFIYATIEKKPLRYVYNLLLDLVVEKYTAYKTGGRNKNVGMLKSIAGLIDVLKKHRFKSYQIRSFLRSPFGREVLNTVAGVN